MAKMLSLNISAWPEAWEHRSGEQCVAALLNHSDTVTDFCKPVTLVMGN